MLTQLSYELLRGFAYLRIRHAEIRVYKFWLPLLLWSILLTTYLVLPIKPTLLGKDGAISATLSVISILPGFFFAGLAAVATFGSPAMDREMPAPAPEIDLLVSGRKVASRLTRRQFLAYLFSYLVIISFLLCFGMISLNIIAPSLDALHSGLADMRFGENVWAFGKIVVVGSILALLSSMLVTTLHGVFFLAEKIHQP